MRLVCYHNRWSRLLPPTEEVPDAVSVCKRKVSQGLGTSFKFSDALHTKLAEPSFDSGIACAEAADDLQHHERDTAASSAL
jgi:hypothetical protein